MSHKALIMALCLSLIFNVFVLLGFVRARTNQAQPPEHHQPSSTQRLERRPPGGSGPDFNRMVRDLRLNEAQRESLRTLQEEHRSTLMEIEQGLTLVRFSLKEELRREEPEVERLRELVGEETDLMRQRRMAEAGMFGRFMEELSPEQRQLIKGRLNQSVNREDRPMPRALIEKFDRNRSGRLEIDELREARRELDRRRRQNNSLQSPPSP